MTHFGMKNIIFVLTISVCLFAGQGEARPNDNGEDYNYFNDEKDYPNVGDSYVDTDTDTDSGEQKGADETYTGDPPLMHSKALNLTAKPGDTVFLPCDVDNFEPFALTWRGKEHLYTDSLKVTLDNRIVKFPNNTIRIQTVKDSDSGNYTCDVSGDPPAVVTHQLHVPTPPQIIEMLPRPDSINNNNVHEKKMRKGDNLVLECQVLGYPKPQITWTRMNKHLRPNKDSVMGTTFTIEKVDRHDDGIYQCSASNGIGSAVHREVQIHVQYAPEVSIEKETVNAAEDLQSELICTVHASPKAVVEWFHNGIPVIDSDHIKLNSVKAKHTLTIKSTKERDFGTYVCKANNSLGINQSVAKIYGIPNQPMFISSIKEDDGISETFEWTVESSSPIIEYKLEYRKTEGKTEWVPVKSPIVQNPEGNKYTLKHKLSLAPNKYEIVLRALNKYGWSEPSKRHTFSLGNNNEAAVPNMTGPQTGTAEPSSSAAEDIRPRIFALMTILCVTAFFL